MSCGGSCKDLRRQAHHRPGPAPRILRYPSLRRILTGAFGKNGCGFITTMQWLPQDRSADVVDAIVEDALLASAARFAAPRSPPARADGLQTSNTCAGGVDHGGWVKTPSDVGIEFCNILLGARRLGRSASELVRCLAGDIYCSVAHAKRRAAGNREQRRRPGDGGFAGCKDLRRHQNVRGCWHIAPRKASTSMEFQVAARWRTTFVRSINGLACWTA